MTARATFAVALMLVGAAMLVVGVGASAVWIATITVGIALVVLDRYRRRPRFRS